MPLNITGTIEAEVSASWNATEMVDRTISISMEEGKVQLYHWDGERDHRIRMDGEELLRIVTRVMESE